MIREEIYIVFSFKTDTSTSIIIVCTFCFEPEMLVMFTTCTVK